MESICIFVIKIKINISLLSVCIFGSFFRQFFISFLQLPSTDRQRDYAEMHTDCEPMDSLCSESVSLSLTKWLAGNFKVIEKRYSLTLAKISSRSIRSCVQHFGWDSQWQFVSNTRLFWQCKLCMRKFPNVNKRQVRKTDSKISRFSGILNFSSLMFFRFSASPFDLFSLVPHRYLHKKTLHGTF